jgi:transcriptional regulator with XRE-family HTH domain
MTQIEARFGLAVRRLRGHKKLSQEALAGQAGLNRSYLGEVERGCVSPSITTAAKLAQALEVPLAELLAACEAPPWALWPAMAPGAKVTAGRRNAHR